MDAAGQDELLAELGVVGVVDASAASNGLSQSPPPLRQTLQASSSSLSSVFSQSPPPQLAVHNHEYADQQWDAAANHERTSPQLAMKEKVKAEKDDPNPFGRGREPQRSRPTNVFAVASNGGGGSDFVSSSSDNGARGNAGVGGGLRTSAPVKQYGSMASALVIPPRRPVLQSAVKAPKGKKMKKGAAGSSRMTSFFSRK